MAERIEALGRALEIVVMARTQVYGTSPAAWDFLFRVSRYLAAEQNREFQRAFACASELGEKDYVAGTAA